MPHSVPKAASALTWHKWPERIHKDQGKRKVTRMGRKHEGQSAMKKRRDTGRERQGTEKKFMWALDSLQLWKHPNACTYWSFWHLGVNFHELGSTILAYPHPTPAECHERPIQPWWVQAQIRSKMKKQNAEKLSHFLVELHSVFISEKSNNIGDICALCEL